MARPQAIYAEHPQEASGSGSLGALAVEISLACEAGDRMGSRIRAALERAVSDPDLSRKILYGVRDQLISLLNAGQACA